MKQSSVKELSIGEIIDMIGVEKTQLQKLKMMHIVSPLENPLVIRKVRRTIARLKAEQTRREIKDNKA